MGTVPKVRVNNSHSGSSKISLLKIRQGCLKRTLNDLENSL